MQSFRWLPHPSALFAEGWDFERRQSRKISWPVRVLSAAKSMNYKDFTSNSLFLKDLATDPRQVFDSQRPQQEGSSTRKFHESGSRKRADSRELRAEN